MMSASARRRRRRRRRSTDYARIVNGLRVIWALRVIWSELGLFRWHVSFCAWPDAYLHSHSRDTPTHVLVLADPQILDHRSYPDRKPWLVTLSRLVVDYNLRRSWWAASALKPDVVIFLGDMMDGGRFAMDDVEYEEYYSRFRNIFRVEPHVPVYFIPGNHDVGLGTSEHFSSHAEDRYASHFGTPNFHVDIVNHTFVFIDAPGLVDEELRRVRIGASFIHWAEVMPNGRIAYIQSLPAASPQKPTVLLTHIPLSRPEGASCGPLRERGTIRKGTGFGYVNTLDEPVSQMLLDTLKPTLILSGDDHDYCEYDHPLPLPEDPCSDSSCSALPLYAREVTVKSFSMAMGVHKPGFQLLSLKPPAANPSQASHSIADRPCILPDQIELYLWGYLLLLVATLGLLLVSNMHRVFRANHSTAHAATRAGYNANAGAGMGWRSASSDTTQRHVMSQRGWEGLGDTEAKLEDDDGEDSDSLPSPAFSTPNHRSSPAYSWTFVFQNRRRRLSCDPSLFLSLLSWCRGEGQRHATRTRGVWGGFCKDVLDVAWVPLGLLAGIAWWMS